VNKPNIERMSDPWKHRDKLPAPRALDVLLACAAVLASSLALLFVMNEQISFVTLLVLTAFSVIGMRRGKDLLLLLVGAFAVSLIFASLGAASAFLGLVIGTASLAYLFTVTALPYAAAIPLAVSLVAFFVSGDPLLAILPSAILPSGALLAAATLSHQRRTTAICFSIGGLLISLGAVLALLLWRACGSLELGAITAYLDGTRHTLIEAVQLIRDEFLVYMQEALAAEGAAEAEITRALDSLKQTMSDEVLSEVIGVLYSILPALATVLCSIVSFEAQLLLSHYYFYRGYRAVLTPDATVFSMSVPAAVIYLVTFIGTVFVGANSVIGAAMQNLCLMLLPGLCVIGVGAVLGMLRTSKGGARVFVLLLSVGAICCAGFSALYFLALWGAYTTILGALGRHMMQKLHGEHHQDGNGGGENDR